MPLLKMSPFTLRERLGDSRILIAPGVYDGLSACQAEASGAEAVYLSGASIAYTLLGRPDIGLVSMTEVAEVISRISDRISIPIIVDADNGYGNALNVQRCVRLFEKAGAAAIQLEDQTLPKRCGHLTGKSLVSGAEMVGKVQAALDARASDRTLIIARTDAIAVEGLDCALDRADAYVAAGADVLFIEAIGGLEEMRMVNDRYRGRVPLLVNIVEGGKTPAMTATELQDLGFSLVIFPGGAVRAISHTLIRYYDSLLAHGTNAPMRDHMLDLKGVNTVVGTQELLALGEKYDSEIKPAFSGDDK